MSNTRPLLAVIAALVLASGAAQAGEETAAESQSEQSSLLDTIRANRKALVAVNLELSEEQGSEFWPLYDECQKELNAIGVRDLSDDKAAKPKEDYLAAEAQRVQVRRTDLPDT